MNAFQNNPGGGSPGFGPNFDAFAAKLVIAPVDHADLAVSQSVAPASNGAVPVTISVTNHGPDAAVAVKLADTVLNGIILTITLSQGTCAPPAGGVFVCNLGTIPTAAQTTVNLTVRQELPGTTLNRANVSSLAVDPQTGNNTSLYVMIVLPRGDVPTRNYFTTKQPTLTWNRVSWALGYQVQAALDPAFKYIVQQPSPLAATVLAWQTPVLPNGIFYWRVRAKVNATTWGAWSAAERFTVNAP